tara:strand:+ start:1240 stop:1422 length:183 start_codon:yes stop_codon:yes gene_type:complete
MTIKEQQLLQLLKDQQLLEELLKDLKELRNEMIQANWPAQRLSNIITTYEMKLQGLDNDD